MTISTTYAPLGYAGPITAPQSLPITWEFNLETDIVVKDGSSVLALTTNYTITGGGGSTGTVELVTSSTDDVTVERVTSQLQGLDYVEGSKFPAASHELGLDIGIMIAQEQENGLARSIVVPAEGASGVSLSLPVPIIGDRALMTDSAGTALKYSDSDVNDFDTQVAAAAASAAASAASAAAALVSEAAALVSELAAAASAAAAASSVSAIGLIPTEQSVADDTVNVSGGIFRHPGDGFSAVTVADDFASAITFPVVTADSRIDLLYVDGAGTAVRVAGTQSASPVPPQHPVATIPICEVTVDETVTVVVNTADIRDVRPIISAHSEAEGLTERILFWSDWTIPNGSHATNPRNEVNSDVHTLLAGETIETAAPVNATLDDYGEVATSTTMTFADTGTPAVFNGLGYTVSGWVDGNSTQWEFKVTGGTNVIFAMKRQTANANFNIAIGIGGNVNTGVVASADATWDHITLTVDGSGNWLFYKNGTLGASGSGTIAANSTLASVSFQETGGSGGLFRFDQSAVYNEVKTAAQVASLYNAGAGRMYSSLT